MAGLAEKTGRRTGRKRSKLQIARDRARMAELDFAGHSHDEISDIMRLETGLAITRRQVGYDLARLHDQWLAEGADTHAKKMVVELKRIDRLERELWKAWQRSQEDAETITEEQVYLEETPKRKKKKGVHQEVDDEWLDGDRQPIKSKLVRQGQSGNPAFLAQIHAVQQERRRLMNLYAASKAEVEITHRVKSYVTVSPADFDNPDAFQKIPQLPAGPPDPFFDVIEADFEEAVVNGQD